VEKYSSWLTAEKVGFNRKRKLSYKTLEEKLINVINSGEISKITGNEKLSMFLKEVVLDRKTFDYSKLKLE